MVWKPARTATDDPCSRLGRAIRHRRHQLGVSIEDLAGGAGISWRYLSDVELGKRNISIVNIEKLSLALGVQTSMLFREYGADPDLPKNLVVYAEGIGKDQAGVAEDASADPSDSTAQQCSLDAASAEK